MHVIFGHISFSSVRCLQAKRKQIEDEEARRRREGLLSDEEDTSMDDVFIPARLRKKEKVIIAYLCESRLLDFK